MTTLDVQPNREVQPSASYSLTIRVELSGRPGSLGRLATAIGDEGGDIDALDIVRVGGGVVVRDITVACRDEAHGEAIARRLGQLEGVRVLHVTDRTFQVHLGGKIEVNGRFPVKTRDDLSMVYTPGVARICLAIRDDPAKQWTLTVKRHMIAVVSDDGRDVQVPTFRPGDIGALATLVETRVLG